MVHQQAMCLQVNHLQLGMAFCKHCFSFLLQFLPVKVIAVILSSCWSGFPNIRSAGCCAVRALASFFHCTHTSWHRSSKLSRGGLLQPSCCCVWESVTCVDADCAKTLAAASVRGGCTVSDKLTVAAFPTAAKDSVYRAGLTR